MTDSPATSSTSAMPADPLATKVFYMNFRFFRLDPIYLRLMANEKVVAKQEFLATFDSVQERMPIATYALTGLRSDCDLMIWRVTPHVKDLHAMSARVQSSGFGKYLIPTASYTGTVTGGQYALPKRERGRRDSPPNVLGTTPYLVVEALRGVRPPAPEGCPAGRLHVADSAGLDEQDFVLACETDDPLKYRAFAAKALQGAERRATYICLQGAMREIIDSLG